LNLEANDDERPTTAQLVARLDGEGWAVDKMRWGLVPGWRSGKPLKNSANGAKDGFNLAGRSRSVTSSPHCSLAGAIPAPLSMDGGVRTVQVDPLANDARGCKPHRFATERRPVGVPATGPLMMRQDVGGLFDVHSESVVERCIGVASIHEMAPKQEHAWM
jgi:hypothetical protein